MGSRPRKPCSQPGCSELVEGGGPCQQHKGMRRRDTDRRRGSAGQRGYGSSWAKNRARFLSCNPLCALCKAQATVADHWPKSRRQLVEAGDPHPDSWSHLRPLCQECHNKETAKNQPGGWNASDPT